MPPTPWAPNFKSLSDRRGVVIEAHGIHAHANVLDLVSPTISAVLCSPNTEAKFASAGGASPNNRNQKGSRFNFSRFLFSASCSCSFPASRCLTIWTPALFATHGGRRTATSGLTAIYVPNYLLSLVTLVLPSPFQSLSSSFTSHPSYLSTVVLPLRPPSLRPPSLRPWHFDTSTLVL